MADDDVWYRSRGRRPKFLTALIGIIVVTVVIVVVAIVLTTVVVPIVDKKESTNATESPLQNSSTHLPESPLQNSSTHLPDATLEDIRIISRQEWHAKDATSDFGNLTLPIKLVIIHHTASQPCTTSSECVDMVQNIQTYQMSKAVDFGDIGFGFIVAGDGEIYEGKGWYKVGAHSFGYNRKSIGIAFLGDFMTTQPPQQQIDASVRLLKIGVTIGALNADYQLVGQRQVKISDSPGTALQNIIETWPHWVQNVTV